MWKTPLPEPGDQDTLLKDFESLWDAWRAERDALKAAIHAARAAGWHDSPGVEPAAESGGES